MVKHLFLMVVLLSGLGMGAAENLLLSPGGEVQKLWRSAPGVSLTVGDNRLSVVIDGAGAVNRRIKLEPEWRYLFLSMEMRATGLIAGDEPWKNGRIAMRFHGADGKPVGAWPDVFGASGTTNLVKCRRIYSIPEGAVELDLSPANFGKSGKIEFIGMDLTAFASLDEFDRDAATPDNSAREQLWDFSDAERHITSTRDRICLNGFWQFFPILDAASAKRIPADRSGWCYFKVPGIWPGMGWGADQPGDNQIIYASSYAPDFDPAKLNSAWYRRTVVPPADWGKRRIELEITMLQTSAQVFVDGEPAGELYFPGGKLDLTGKLKPGTRHELALLISAKQDGLTGQVFMAPDRLVPADATVRNRGVTGDVFLSAEPMKNAISDVHIITGYRKKQISFDVGITRTSAGRYRLEAELRDGKEFVATFRSEPFSVAAQECFRTAFSADWFAPKLWDTDTPENLYTAELRLLDGDGKVVDVFHPQEFGFREFWIDGRNFMLNGSVIHLRSLVSSTMREGAARSCAAVTAQQAHRAKALGFNHIIAYNYSFKPGIIGYQDDFYIQSSKAGVLTSLSMPHAADFNWNLDNPAEKARYLAYSEFLIRRFQNLPGVVFYAANHNATGYIGDQNPLRLDGVYTPDAFQKNNNRIQAKKTAELIRSLDPTRPVYHHESGNLGEMMTLNCYLNWAPAQERGDWLEHWEANGVKPLIMVEWGMPHTASWTSYRGPGFVYAPNCKGVQCIWLDEYNASLLGEEVYRTTPQKEAAYRNQEKRSKNDTPVHYVDIFPVREETLASCAAMMKTNFRELRARGLSGLLPWDQDLFWKQPEKRVAESWPKRFENLKQPGIVPDISRPGGNYLVDYQAEYQLTEIGAAGLPAMRELFGWIAGKPGDFTEKGHNYRPGETVEKTIMLLNDSRRIRKATVTWRVPALKLQGAEETVIAPGARRELHFRFTVPADSAATELEMEAEMRFDTGETVVDRFSVDVIPASFAQIKSRIGLYDPAGKSLATMRELKIPFMQVNSEADLGRVDLLVVGREGLADCKLRLDRMMEKGGRLLVLEQTLSTLSRLGFRGQEYGLRNVFPLLPEFSDQTVRDWRGSSTLTAPYLTLPELEQSYPKWEWEGFSNDRVWRAGNRGNVSSVPLEKPTVGNALPMMQGGFDLQYTPALELRHRNGVAIFSQFDFSGRSESDPQAIELLRKLILRLDLASPSPTLPTFYTGNAAGEKLLQALNIDFQVTAEIPEKGLLIVGSGARLPELSEAVKRGLRVLMLGVSGAELERMFPGGFETKPGKYFSDYVENPSRIPEFQGISTADLHWRKELEFDAFEPGTDGGRALRVLRRGEGMAVALQVTPWMFEPLEFQFRTSQKRNTAVLSRLLHNLGASEPPGGWNALTPRMASEQLSLNAGWRGKTDPGEKGRDAGYFLPDYREDGTWKTVTVPGRFDLQRTEWNNYVGLFWYRLDFTLPLEPLTAPARFQLNFGAIDDESWIWLNGKFIGEVTQKTNPDDYWAAQRGYQITGSDLRPGRNQLTVLCRNLRGGAGIFGSPVLRLIPPVKFYMDQPVSSDDPYRYFRW